MTTRPRFVQPAAATAILLMLTLVSGCIPSKPISNEQADQYWRLQPDIWPQATPTMISLGDHKLPGRWVFHQEPNAAAATGSIAEAVQKLREGPAQPSIDISVSPAHSEMIADSLADVRQVILRLRETAEAGRLGSPAQWAEALADALVAVERSTRFEGRPDPGGTPTGWTAGPAITLLTALLHEWSGSALLAGMSPAEQRNLRLVVTQAILRVGFIAANKTAPTGLAQQVVTVMQQARNPTDLRKSLQKMLAGALPQAPETPGDDPDEQIVRGSLKGLPAALRVFEVLLRQWGRMDYAEIEYRRFDDHAVVSMTFKTRPGKKLELKDLYFMQPDMSLQGTMRMTVMPDRPPAQSVSVLFEPLEKGSAARMELPGLGWGLVRLLAIPIANGDLREISVWSGGNPTHNGINVALLMTVPGSKDPRRVLAFSNIKQQELSRTITEVGYKVLRREIDITYMTPKRVYVYRNVKHQP